MFPFLCKIRGREIDRMSFRVIYDESATSTNSYYEGTRFVFRAYFIILELIKKNKFKEKEIRKT